MAVAENRMGCSEAFMAAITVTASRCPHCCSPERWSTICYAMSSLIGICPVFVWTDPNPRESSTLEKVILLLRYVIGIGPAMQKRKCSAHLREQNRNRLSQTTLATSAPDPPAMALFICQKASHTHAQFA